MPCTATKSSRHGLSAVHRKEANNISLRENAPGGLREHWPRYVVLLVLVVFLFAVRRILMPFIIGAVLAYVLTPVVSRMERRIPLPRVAVVGLFFILTLLPVVLAAIVVTPALLRETTGLAIRTPDILASTIAQLLNGERAMLFGQEVEARDIADQILRSLLDFLGQPAEAVHIATAVMELILYSVLSLVLVFYFLVDRERFGRAFLSLLPEHLRQRVGETAENIDEVLGRYLEGLLILVVLMSTVTYLGLTFLFHLPFSLPIAIATGFLEIIPLFGPIAAGAIAALVGLEYGGVSFAIWIIVFYYVVRQIEDQVIAPNVLGRAVELHPVVAIFAVLAGGLLAGVIGMMLAIPTAGAIKVVMDHWQLRE